ncbi:chitinase 18-18 [Metarhizium rileyi]|uniref:Chitinase 18-18 n=1 Tax=Metarhizium rileyi (strain RCEF 4871) TaxID=1649241 RepID=A0A167GSW4_METRR|nr:chitinase 18-18 [Metarhizium rileyi RCEF 4871]
MSLSLGLGAGGASAALNAYWGQTGGYRLRDICDSGVNYATVSFINNSPEHGKGGYPGSNFGANCAAEAYPHHKTKQPTELLSNCYLIKEDIPYCQSKGVKVLLAIGGQASLTSQYAVSSVDKGIEFAEFLYKAYGPYDSSWEGPRPFDNSETEHVSIDGFDLDLEDKTSDFSNEPYIAMVDWWREQKQAMFITAAPECVITSKWLKNQNDDLIHNAKFDALFIQFYNNPVCDALNGGFSYDAWAEQIASGKSKDAKLFIGLPALATSSGYYPQEKLKELVCEYSRHKNFGGVSLWDGTQAMNNHVTKGQSYLQSAMDAVKYLCHEPPKSTASNSTSTTPTASVSSKMLATSKASASKMLATSKGVC